MNKIKLSLPAMLVLILSWHPLQAGTVLTFDHNPTVRFERIKQTYGDRVVATPDANGHQYLIVDDGFGTTPNVELEYGGPLPSIWTSGYGDLVNVLFNDQDGDDELSIALLADPGFEVGLFGFDLASFSSGGQTIAGFEIRDLAADTPLLTQGTTLVSGTTRNSYDFGGGLFAAAIGIRIDLTGLGTLSDNIAIDNIYFAQTGVSPIPLPAAFWLFASALLGLVGFKRTTRGGLARENR